MAAPMTCNEIKKPQSRIERPATVKAAKTNVRPEVANLIRKVMVENSPTWKELAKR